MDSDMYGSGEPTLTMPLPTANTVVCKVCLKKHGEELDEENDEIEPPDESEADDGMHDDMQ